MSTEAKTPNSFPSDADVTEAVRNALHFHDVNAQECEISLHVPPTTQKERLWILEMLAKLQPYIKSMKPPPHDLSTLRKYYYRFKRLGLKAFVRRIYDRGNTNGKADPETVKLARKIIKDEHLTPTHSNIQGGYALYEKTCEIRHLFPISDTWFKELIQQVPLEKRISAREGRRRAYSHQRGTGPHFLDPDRNGGWYFGRSHVDTTQIPVELLCRYTGIRLGKANLIAMIDSYTLDLLAYLITLLPVTRAVVMALFRLCIQVHGRVAIEDMVDKGPDLQAIDVREFEAAARCTVIDRRTRAARDGRPAEDLFGLLQKSLWPNIEGNTQNSKYPRGMSPEVDPRVRAVHTIDSLDRLFSKFIHDEYRTHPRGTLAASPNDLREYSLSHHGQRNFTRIANDRNLLIATSATARPVMSTIHHRRGVLLAPFEYWSDRFTDVSLVGRSVMRRPDYLNCSRMFVGFDDEWIDACSNPHPLTAQMSSREQHYLSEEYYRRYNRELELNHANMESLGSFLMELREDESHLRTLLKCRGDKAHLDGVFGNPEDEPESSADNSHINIPKPNRLYGIDSL